MDRSDPKKLKTKQPSMLSLKLGPLEVAKEARVQAVKMVLCMYLSRDANSTVIFIPRGFGELGIAFFHSSRIRGSRIYFLGSSGIFGEFP